MLAISSQFYIVAAQITTLEYEQNSSNRDIRGL